MAEQWRMDGLDCGGNRLAAAGLLAVIGVKAETYLCEAAHFDCVRPTVEAAEIVFLAIFEDFHMPSSARLVPRDAMCA